MPAIDEDDDDDVIELGISTDKVRFIIVKARQFDAKEGDADPDEGSNAPTTTWWTFWRTNRRTTPSAASSPPSSAD